MSEVMEQEGALQSYIDALMVTGGEPDAHQMTPSKSLASAASRYLLFAVDGLLLTLPLTRLAGVRDKKRCSGPPASDEENPSEAAIRVVDTQARIFDGTARACRDHDYPYVLMLDEGRWGLGCDSVGEVIDLTPEQVQWRGEHSRRPWLAGTLKEHACALLDLDACLQLWGAS